MNMPLRKPTNAVLIDLTRCEAASDRQRELTRRSQALLAAAGDDRPARRWFVVTVKAGMDKAVADALDEAGVETWLPFVSVMPTRRGGMPKVARKPVQRLAMRGYVFVKVEATIKAWSGLMTVKGTSGMLGNGGRPFAIADRSVELLKAYLSDNPQAQKVVLNLVRAGDSVIVRDGPFRSFPALVNAVDDERERVAVEVMLFGRATPVELDLAQIVKL